MGSCRCGEKWTGLNRCHCGGLGCHRTFNSLGAFDKHRKDFKCLDPLEIGMQMSETGIWGTPMSEELKAKLGYGPKP